LLAVILLSPTGHSSQTEWWQDSFQKGLDYLQAGESIQAEAELKSILDKEKIPAVYVALGRVYEKMGPGSRKARKQFENAKRKNRKFAPAYYWLGINYEHQPNRLIKAREYYRQAVYYDRSYVVAWMRLAKAQEELDQVSEAVKAYAQAFYHNPENEYIYQIFMEAALKFHGAKEAKKTLAKLIKENKAEPSFRVDLAEMLYEEGEYKKSATEISSLDVLAPQYSSTKKLLVLAKIQFATGDTLAANENYWQAVSSIKDSTDGTILFKDVSYLVQKKEYNNYVKLKSTDFSDFFKRFWKARDPNKATSINERIAEHYTRLRYVLKNNRRYTRGYSVNEFLYESLHPFDTYNLQGNKLLAKADFPEAILESRNIDDMGLIYLRHGPPDDHVTSADGLPVYVNESVVLEQFQQRSRSEQSSDPLMQVPKPYMGQSLLNEGYKAGLPLNTSWKYNSTGDVPEMIFHFKMYGGLTSWIIEAIPYTFANREDLHSKFMQMGREAFEARPDPAAISQYANEMSNESVETIQKALTTDRSSYIFNEAPLIVPYKMLAFKNKNEGNTIDLFYLIEGKQTELDQNTNPTSLELSTFMGYYDNNWNTIYENNFSNRFALGSTAELWKTQSFIDKKVVDLPPGIYNYEMHFKDKTSNKLAAYKGEYVVPNFFVDSLQVSDVLLSSAILPKGNAIKFAKGDISYKPHMFRAFEKGEIVGLYFEIYNLGLDAVGKTSFKVDCSIDLGGGQGESKLAALNAYFRTLFGNKKGQVTTSYTYTGNLRDEKIYINLNLKDIESGNQDLYIKVKDNILGEELTRLVRFTILNEVSADTLGQ
jgi:GWxTD domain-containing protein